MKKLLMSVAFIALVGNIVPAALPDRFRLDSYVVCTI